MTKRHEESSLFFSCRLYSVESWCASRWNSSSQWENSPESFLQLVEQNKSEFFFFIITIICENFRNSPAASLAHTHVSTCFLNNLFISRKLDPRGKLNTSVHIIILIQSKQHRTRPALYKGSHLLRAAIIFHGAQANGAWRRFKVRIHESLLSTRADTLTHLKQRSRVWGSRCFFLYTVVGSIQSQRKTNRFIRLIVSPLSRDSRRWRRAAADVLRRIPPNNSTITPDIISRYYVLKEATLCHYNWCNEK